MSSAFGPSPFAFDAATKSSGLLEIGGRTYLLGGADASVFPAADGRPGGVPDPAFDGDVAGYVAAGNDGKVEEGEGVIEGVIQRPGVI